MSILIILSLVTAVAAVWPLPSQFSYGTSVLYIDPSVSVTYTANNQTGSSYGGQSSRPSIVSTAIECTLDTIFHKALYPWKLRPRNTDFDPTSNSTRTKISSIKLTQNSPDPADIQTVATGDLDESYTLIVTDSGDVSITANTSIGLSYGLTTFSQLFYRTKSGQIYTPLAPVSIEDAPTFAHRGLNMDIARSYYPPSAMYRQIDALAYNKLNRLHLHITDSQSWPLEIPALPLLAEKGAYGPGLTYSPTVLKDILQYGADRGVQVYLEIDMPGHIGIVTLAYPDLTVAWNIQPDWDTWALEPPSGAMKLNSTDVNNFLETLFDDILPRTKPYSNNWHAGGDEVVVEQYLLESGIESNDSTVVKPFMQRFVDRNLNQIRGKGFTPIVWQELLLEWNLTLASDVVVQIWKSPEDALSSVQKGHKTIVGDYNNWYLDCGYGQWLDFYPGTSSEGFYPYTDYCSPRKNWRQIYAYDPLNGIPSNLTHLILGGEAHIWSEQTDDTNVDGKVWPRAAAAAEVLWSGAKDAQGQNRSQVLASPRLAEMRERLVLKGIQAEVVQMPFCTQNGTQCAL